MDDETALGEAIDDTTVIPDIRAPQAAPALAWSTEEPDTDDFAEDDDPEPKLGRRQRELLDWMEPDDELWNDDDDAAYSRGTVKIFVGLIAFALIALAWMVGVWATHRAENSPPAASQTTTPVTVTVQAPPPATDQAAPEPTATVNAPTSATEPQPRQSPDDKFVTFIRTSDMASAFAGYGDLDLIVDGDKVCDALRQGTPVADVQRQEMPNTTVQQFAWFTDTASADYCPQFSG